MKKLFALLLAAVMCLSLCACDGIVSDGASSGGATPGNAGRGKIKTITLTLENFNDYFELKEVLTVPTNAFGEVDKEKSVTIDTVYVLKPEYQEKFVTEWDYESAYSIEWTYINRCQEGVFDYDKNTYTLGDELRPTTDEESIYLWDPVEKTSMQKVELYSADRSFRVGSVLFTKWVSFEYCYVDEFKEVTRIAGTLYIYE